MEPQAIEIDALSARDATVHITVSRDPKVDGFGFVNTRLRAPLPGSFIPANLLNVTDNFDLADRAEVVTKSEELARNRARLLGYRVRSVEFEDRLEKGALPASPRVPASVLHESASGVDPVLSA